MRNCNWMVTDTLNKKNDLCAYVRATAKNLEEKVLGVHKVSKLMNAKEREQMWSTLPDQYKNLNNKNLGCA